MNILLLKNLTINAIGTMLLIGLCFNHGIQLPPTENDAINR